MRRLIALAVMLLAQPAHAIVNGYIPAPEVTRFDAVGALGLVSGLLEGHTWHCAATLVRENVVLTAGHCVIAGQDHAVRFRRATDGTIGSLLAGPGSFFHAQVASWYFPASGDAALGTLAHPVHHIEPIPLGFAEDISIGSPAEVAGWGRIGPGPGEGALIRLKVCDNELLLVLDEQLNFCSAWNGACWAMCGPNSNDSGGAVIAGGASAARVIGAVVDFSSAVAVAQYASDPAFNPGAERPRKEQ